MKNNRKFLVGMLTAVFLILASCGNSTDESKVTLDNQPPDNNARQNTKDNSLDTDNINGNEADLPNDDLAKQEDLSSNHTESLKEEYLKKLNDTKREIDKVRNNNEDETTYALKKVEGDRYDVWDGLLNEVYGVLINQLPAEEMDQLRKEQREWIDYRDHTAKEASLKYKGGTMEQLEYVTVENDLTEERCFELVEKYMR
ncbi:lysozyme inhibitor LprI family protein [Pseudalkalibacillus caeni]|uniref:DUF1311 domain-containing protein n=1 Tax=Exobacillus caeni TaxID=2574798 RepID=A0A5R9F860_9BACL|nr:lysozyme inhibitor LprI family protein [Pseudalkalibacillus caeni]TLS37033.1 DUF1311 domain-containing protein [Pseudalkalibacillus caeni]